MKILVTGSSGLIGSHLCSLLEAQGHHVVRVVRSARSANETGVGEINGSTRWDNLLKQGVDVVIHLAARLPVMGASAEQTEHYLQTNTAGTTHLADKCAEFGIRRFIFISTVKVLGESRSSPYKATDLALPADAYAMSKWDAEQQLQQISADTGMELVILRPPLVYGPHVKGNFLNLLQVVAARRPLPLKSINNRRSLIYVGNLADAIATCAHHPLAAGQTFMISDGDDVSTPELIERISLALHVKPKLISVPVALMKWAGTLTGKQAAIERLTGSLCVDSRPIQQTLSWHAPYSMQQGLEETGRWFLKQSEQQNVANV